MVSVFRSASLKGRLIASFSVPVVLLAAMGFVSQRAASQINDNVHSVAAIRLPIVVNLLEADRELIDDISAASKQHSQGLDQIAQAIAQMEKVTQHTAASAEESAAASEDLLANAEAARRAVHDLMALAGAVDESHAGRHDDAGRSTAAWAEAA